MLRKLVLGAAALALCVPAGAAFAHDGDEDGGYDYYWQHAQDHREHAEFHEEDAEAHARAHERGFYSPEDRARWHEAQREAHQALHEDHPDTWHDYYGWRGYYARPYYGYSYRAYDPYRYTYRGY
jgi:hypothetical protein